MTDKALDAVAEALSALIAERYPDGALMGAWTVSCEVLLPEACLLYTSPSPRD